MESEKQTSSRKVTSDDPASDKDRAKRKASKKSNSSTDQTKAKKPKQKNNNGVALSPVSKKRKGDKPNSRRKSNDDDSDEESIDDSLKGYVDMMPEVGDEVAIKCPPDPPYPEGWYSGVVIEVVRHDQDFKASNKGSKKKSFLDYTVHVEWDGGGVEEIRNPEWRVKGDEPDKQGRISHRDNRLRPYFKYWVNRLNSINEAEKKLSRTRAGKNMRVDSAPRIEWIKCSNPNCGKWRALPTYLKSSDVLESCNNTWFCVLNTWDEGMASCSAHQETGYMPAANEDI